MADSIWDRFEEQSPTWNSSQGRRLAWRDFIRNTLPNGRVGGHVIEDLDLGHRLFRTGRSDGSYERMLRDSSGGLLTEDDIRAVVLKRSALDERGIVGACEVKTCKDDCEHTMRRPPPKDVCTLQPSKRLTFRELLNGERYIGFFLVHLEHEDPLLSDWFYINGKPADLRQCLLVWACCPELAGIEPWDLR